MSAPQIADIKGIIVHGHPPRFSVEKQRAALERAGVKDCFEQGLKVHSNDKPLDIEYMWGRGQKGRQLVVHWLFLVINRRANAKAKRKLLLQFVDEVRSRGSEILEVGSGRNTANPEDRVAMLADALDAVTKGRMPSQTEQKGRPRKRWSAGQRKDIWSAWLSIEYATNEEAAEAASETLGFRVTPNQMWHVVQEMRIAKGDPSATGASGRPWKKTRR